MQSWMFGLKWFSAFLMVFLAALWVGTPRMHQRVVLLDPLLAPPAAVGSTGEGMQPYDLEDTFEQTLQKIQRNVVLSIRDRFPDVETAAPRSTAPGGGAAGPLPPPVQLARVMQQVSLLDHSFLDPIDRKSVV